MRGKYRTRRLEASGIKGVVFYSTLWRSFITLALILGMFPVLSYADEVYTDDYIVLSSEGGTLESGNYRLESDVSLENDLVIADDVVVTLDLNGHTLTGTGTDSVITVSGEKTSFTLEDRTAYYEVDGTYVSGSLTGGATNSHGGGVCVSNEYGSFQEDKAMTSFTMTGGTIEGNTAYYGGGVSVYAGSSFTMTGGLITSNTATVFGGGVFVIGNALVYPESDNSLNQLSAKPGSDFALLDSSDEIPSYVYVSNSPVISGNIVSDGATDNVFIGDTYSRIYVTDALSDKAHIGVYCNYKSYGTMSHPVYAYGTDDYQVTDADAACFSDDNGIYSFVARDNTIYAQASLEEAALTLDSTVVNYDGSVRVPTIIVDFNGRTLTQTIDYVYEVQDAQGITVSDPVDVGTYTIVVTGAGSFTGTLSATYEIRHFMERLGGSNRYKTMELIAQAAFADKECETVIICRGNKFPDALAAAGLAGALNAQVLLTATDKLSSETASEIARLEAKSAIVVGDNAAISNSTYAAIESLVGTENTTRVCGANRYETALEICKSVVKTNEADGKTTDTVIVTTGVRAADSLSVSSVAYALHAPIILVNKSKNISSDALEAIVDAGATRVLVLGDENSVSEASVDILEKYELEVVRLSGVNRYATSIEVAKYAINTLGFTCAHAAVTAGNGSKYADALVASALCGKAESPVLLVSSEDSEAPLVASLLQEHAGEVERIYVLGSSSSVSNELFTAIETVVGTKLARLSVA